MTPARNFIWGIQRDIRLEAERQARERQTVWVYTLRCDFQVENPEMAVLLKNLV
jgi:hypothetical protein